MHFHKSASILLSAVLLAAAVPNTAAHASSFSMPDIVGELKQVSISEIEVSSDFVQASSFQEGVSQMRSYMAERKTEFTISIPSNSVSSFDDAPKIILAEVFKETQKGCEGDYLRYGLGRYDCNYSMSSGKITMNFIMQYYTTSSDEQKVTDECRKVLDSLGVGNMPDYDKIITIYRYIADNTKYAKSISDKHVFTAYGALIDHVAVCQGYSQLFYRMTKEAGLSCRIISGKSNGENHTWNIVKLGGIYYLVDVTWDSSLGNNSMIYFLKGSKDFDLVMTKYTHTPEYEYNIIFDDFNSPEFKANYPISEYKYAASTVLSDGDINGNGKIDAVDASSILKYYADTSAGRSGSFSKNQQAAADVNKNGKIDAVDASCILSYYAESSVRNVGTLPDFISRMK